MCHACVFCFTHEIIFLCSLMLLPSLLALLLLPLSQTLLSMMRLSSASNIFNDGNYDDARCYYCIWRLIIIIHKIKIYCVLFIYKIICPLLLLIVLCMHENYCTKHVFSIIINCIDIVNGVHVTTMLIWCMACALLHLMF